METAIQTGIREDDELLTAREVGDKLKLSHRTVMNKGHLGELTRVKVGTRTIRYLRSEINAMVLKLS